MTYISNKDFFLEAARGNVKGVSTVNKFGHAPSGVQTSATDIWTRADSVATQQIWTAPTEARIHSIASASASDDGDPVGVGAQTIQVYGLTGWGTAEVSEIVTLDGTSGVNTANSYVIIHRMRVTASGASGPNVGTITATAATDGTITAVIGAGIGQTEMAIYGVPSTQTLYLTKYYASIEEAGGTPSTSNAVDITLKMCPFPDVEETVFITKHRNAAANTSNGKLDHPFEPYAGCAGPCIMKVQGLADSADTNLSAGFEGFLVNNN